MANPNPQHNPTDGLGVAAFVQLTGTGLTNPSGGALTVSGEQGTNGQGIGAVASTNHPVAQYALTLSVSGTSPNAATSQLTVVLKDVANTTYTPVGSPVYVSYNNPSIDGDGDVPAWLNLSNFAGYSPDVASVSSSGLITALHVGQAIIEVQFPFSDNTLGNGATGATDGGSPMQQNPTMMIFNQVIVTVVP